MRDKRIIYSKNIQLLLLGYVLIIDYVNVLKWNVPIWHELLLILPYFVYFLLILYGKPWKNTDIWFKRLYRVEFTYIIIFSLDSTMTLFRGINPSLIFTLIKFFLFFSIYFKFSEKYISLVFEQGGLLCKEGGGRSEDD